jgi:hypothetical protein
VRIKDRMVGRDAEPARIECRSCGGTMTFAQSAVQYGRLRRDGFDHDQAKVILPLCQKCMTKALKTRVFR